MQTNETDKLKFKRNVLSVIHKTSIRYITTLLLLVIISIISIISIINAQVGLIHSFVLANAWLLLTVIRLAFKPIKKFLTAALCSDAFVKLKVEDFICESALELAMLAFLCKFVSCLFFCAGVTTTILILNVLRSVLFM